MKYFNVEIFDGMPQKDLYLDENVALEDQWVHLTQDVTCIRYPKHGVLEFYLDVGWYPDSDITPESCFVIRAMETSFTDGNIFYKREAKTIAEMKRCLAEGALIIHSFNAMDEAMQRAIKQPN